MAFSEQHLSKLDTTSNLKLFQKILWNGESRKNLTYKNNRMGLPVVSAQSLRHKFATHDNDIDRLSPWQYPITSTTIKTASLLKMGMQMPQAYRASAGEDIPLYTKSGNHSKTRGCVSHSEASWPATVSKHFDLSYDGSSALLEKNTESSLASRNITPSIVSAKQSVRCPLSNHDRRNVNGGLTYDDWLLIKCKLASDIQRQRRREALCLSAAEEVRKKISDKSYADWLASKNKLDWSVRTNKAFSQPKGNAGIKRPVQRGSYGGSQPGHSPHKVYPHVEQWQYSKAKEQQRRLLAKRRALYEFAVRAKERQQLSKIP